MVADMNPPQKVITDNNKAPLVQVLTLMFMVIAVLACFVRTGTKIHMIKTLRVDDILTIVATVLAVAQSIAVYIACEHGLGKHFDTLSSSDADSFFKSQYATDTMFMASVFCCKLSGTISLRMFTLKNRKKIVYACEAIVGAWGLTAIGVNLFQCGLPTPWLYTDYTKCINRTAFWTYYSVANIVTDFAIVILMCQSVARIHTSWSKKILVMGVFGSRILVTPAIAVQIYFSNKAFPSTDFTFSIWEAAIAIQLVQCLAILTVCIPNFKVFLDSVESGQIRIDDLRRKGKSSSNGYPTYRPGYAGYKSSQSSGMGSKSRRYASVDDPSTSQTQHSEVHEMVVFSKGKGRGASRTVAEDPDTAWDGQSHTSHTSHSSQKILIQQTWQVDVENRQERDLERL
ncbi:hypothetical protein ACJ41O_006368 [Fusarium nematophilum]